MVQCTVNGVQLNAIIDTGAQISIMSEDCVELCKLQRCVDNRFIGKAIGVGESEIIGKVPQLPVTIGPLGFDAGVAVLKDSNVDFIIGMDILRKLQSEISIKNQIIKLREQNREFTIPLIRSSINTNRNRNTKLEAQPARNQRPSFEDPSILSSGEAHIPLQLSAEFVSQSLDSNEATIEAEEKISLEGI